MSNIVDFPTFKRKDKIKNQLIMEATIMTIVNQVASDVKIKPGDNLIDSGFDSIKLIQLIVEIEKQFNIVIPDEDLQIENFSTIKTITALVNKYL